MLTRFSFSSSRWASHTRKSPSATKEKKTAIAFNAVKIDESKPPLINHAHPLRLGGDYERMGAQSYMQLCFFRVRFFHVSQEGFGLAFTFTEVRNLDP